jgi:hypothetical protein
MLDGAKEGEVGNEYYSVYCSSPIVQIYEHTFATTDYCSFYRFEKDRR